MDIKYYKLAQSDTRYLYELIQVYERVFEMKNFQMPAEAYLAQLLKNDQIIFYVALSEDKHVIGGLTAYVMPSVYYAAPEVYIYDLAVEQHCQRKGVGKGLIGALQRYCKSLGCKYIFVQADLEDQHAIDFYRATGGLQEDVVHFDYVLAGTGEL
ncbi:MAG TPA: GNAT family N-acetyltransferase [Niabella sp.]|nr:GNAT family N-acetyltransferase [Niabella sp.]